MSLVGALLFCNDCGGLLERCPASQANIDCDVCGKRNQNKWPTSITTESASTAFPSRLRDARSEIQVLSAEDRETWAMTTTACPQCANPEMRFRDVQLRGADEGSKLCSGCKNIRYCSHAHQKDDWDIHFNVCKQFVELGEHPSPRMRRVLYFRTKTTAKPEFQWLPLRSGTGYEQPDWESEELLRSTQGARGRKKEGRGRRR
ncbi:hypothetical protein E4T38_04100 [Aureobasidium subglaciale]|nr:hypothetical protein E4T38_04100 [Aureobasidium subglaciale]KAI5224858.1 hypothetical protein E4T40_03875 [Aureobasidium subglaciale]KAI5227927.1 hypothetical protein E4T41_04095 [Aureobasidium subglaciale]KAI5263451.1 hypothetical protein E4T46_03716 [Aureobasidium subglaciale]